MSIQQIVTQFIADIKLARWQELVSTIMQILSVWFARKNNVLVYYPIFDNTVEGIIYDILNNKKKIIGTVMGDTQDETNVVEEILKEISRMR